jgi:serine/threonine-protein kinase
MNPQSSIAHYRITSKLGQGGMGEVWRATDTKLNRDVAIKILPGTFAQDADRMSRFTREAQVLASLNHPNIAAIYGVEERALVMELVEGPTLTDRIAQGVIRQEEALDIARQIAEALEAAHEKGIVHRDLKPGNVKLTAEGKVKVLDFGLAKAQESASEAGSVEDSPTVTLSATRPGLILGTAGYMAPEQARGGAVDKRADIWAFGVVLYEMLTGRRLFKGDTVSDTLAAVLKTDPDMSSIPMQVRPIVERCLRKDPRRRWRDIGDVRMALEEGPTAPPSPLRRNVLLWAAIGGALLAMLGGVGWWLAWRATRPVEHPLTRLSVDLGPDAMTGLDVTAAISPDGRRLAFRARAPNDKQQLAVRLLDQPQATLLAGTENGHDPFFSPDSQWVGFFADSKLKKISVQGGAPVTLCDATFDYGASWGEDGTIIAALNVISGLSQVPAAGGRPRPFTKLGKGEQTHRWPQILPGGQAVLFTGAPNTAGMENASIQAKSLKSGATKTLVAGGYFGRYLPANGSRGYLVYLHQGMLFGVGFDPDRSELQGTPVPLLEDVAASPIQGGGQFDVSATGTLVYLAGKQAAENWPVVWLDRSGKMQPLIATPGTYAYPRFSSNGRRLMLTMSTSSGSGTDIYVHELDRQIMTRLTFGGHAQAPVWAPDGKHIAFRLSASGIAWVRSDGSGEPQQLLTAQNIATPWSFSPDGRRLAYVELNPATEARKIWTLPLDMSDPDHPKPGKSDLFLEGPSDENAPFFSPDGRWIAYRSNESGMDEVYVRPFPAGRGGRWQISTGGGLYGIWSNNRRELFYEPTNNRIMVMDYMINGESFVPGKSRLWSDKQIFYPGNSNLDLGPDGKRFAVFPMQEAAGPGKGSVHITLLLNFFDELRRKVPTSK